MPLRKIAVWGHYCERCGHRWVPRGVDQSFQRAAGGELLDPGDPGERPKDPEAEPTVCPACKSPYWNKARKDVTPTKAPMVKRRSKR